MSDLPSWVADAIRANGSTFNAWWDRNGEKVIKSLPADIQNIRWEDFKSVLNNVDRADKDSNPMIAAVLTVIAYELVKTGGVDTEAPKPITQADQEKLVTILENGTNRAMIVGLLKAISRNAGEALESAGPQVADFVANMAKDATKDNEKARLIHTILDLAVMINKTATSLIGGALKNWGKSGGDDNDDEVPTPEYVRANREQLKETVRTQKDAIVDAFANKSPSQFRSITKEYAGKIANFLENYGDYIIDGYAGVGAGALTLASAGLGVVLTPIIFAIAWVYKKGNHFAAGKLKEYSGAGERKRKYRYTGAYARFVSHKKGGCGCDKVGGVDMLDAEDDFDTPYGLSKYGSSESNSIINSLMDAIVESYKTFGFDTAEGKDINTRIAKVLSLVPTPDQISKDPEKHKKNINIIAKKLNDQFGANIVVTDNYVAAARQIADWLRSMVQSLGDQFSSVRLLIVDTVKSGLITSNLGKQLAKKWSEEVKNLAPEASRVSEINEELFNRLFAEIDRLMGVLQVATASYIKPNSSKLSDLIDINDEFYKMAETAVEPGTHDFSRFLSHFLRNLGVTAKMASIINETLIKIGSSLQEYMSASDFEQIKQSAMKNFAAKETMDPEMIKTLQNALDLLSDFWPNRQQVSDVLANSKSGARDMYTAEEADETIQRILKTRDQIMKTYDGLLAPAITALSQSIKSLKYIAGKKDLSDEARNSLDLFTKALLTFNDNADVFMTNRLANDASNLFNQEKLIFQLSGYYNDAASRERKHRIISGIEAIIKQGEELKKHLDTGDASKIQELITNAQGLINVISHISDSINRTFGNMGGYRYTGSYEGGALDDYNRVFVEDSISGLSSSERRMEDLFSEIKSIGLKFRVADLDWHMTRVAADIEKYKENYDLLLGKSVASRIDEITKKFDADMELLKHISDQKLLTDDKDRREIPIAKEFLRKKYEATINFWRILQTIDKYLVVFTEDRIKNIEEISELEKIMSRVQWPQPGSQYATLGDELTRAFECFPSDYDANGPTSKMKEEWVDKTVESHYYSMFKVAAHKPGIPYIPIMPSGVTDAFKHLNNVIAYNDIIPRIFSLFTYIGWKYGLADKKGDASALVSPKAIYNGLIDYMMFSAFGRDFAGSVDYRSRLYDVRTEVHDLIRIVGDKFLDLWTKADYGDIIAGLTKDKKKEALDKFCTEVNQRSDILMGRFNNASADLVDDLVDAMNINTVIAGFATAANVVAEFDNLKDKIKQAVKKDKRLAELMKVDKKMGHGKYKYQYNLNTYEFEAADANPGSVRDSGTILIGLVDGNVNTINTTTKFRAKFGGYLRGITKGSDDTRPFIQDNNSFEEDQMFVKAIKALFANILVKVKGATVLSAPEFQAQAYTVRSIYGGSDSIPEIVPENLDIYYRILLFASWYKKAIVGENANYNAWKKYEKIKFGSADNEGAVRFTPLFKGDFAPFMQIYFSRLKDVPREGLTNHDLAELIGELNKVIQIKKPSCPKGMSLTKHVINAFVSEVNDNLLLLTKEFADKLEMLQNDRYGYNHLDKVGFNTNKGIASYFDLGTATNIAVPSDRFARASKILQGSGLEKYGFTMEYWDVIRRFRCLIDNNLEAVKYGDDKKKVDIRGQVSRAQKQMLSETSNEKRLEIAATLIRGMSTLSNIDAVKNMIWHETVVAGLNALSVMYTTLKRFQIVMYTLGNYKTIVKNAIKGAGVGVPTDHKLFRERVAMQIAMDLHVTIDNVLDVIGDVFGRRSNRQAVGGLVDDELAINGTLRRTLIDFATKPWDTATNTHLGRLLKDKQDDLDKLDTEFAKTDAGKIFFRYVFDRQYCMGLFLDTLSDLTGDLRGLVNVTINEGKFSVSFDGLKSLAENMFASVTFFADALRLHMPPEVYDSYTHKMNFGSLNWIREQMFEKMFEGRDANKYLTKNMATKDNPGYISLAKTVRYMNTFFEDATQKYDKTLGANFAVALNNTDDTNRYESFANVFAERIYYDINKPNIGVVDKNVADEITYNDLGLVDVGGLRDKIERLFLTRSGEKGAQFVDMRYCARFKNLYDWSGQINENRSVMFVFNQLIAKYVNQCYDPLTQKIYMSAIDKFVAGPSNAAIINPDKASWPDMWPAVYFKTKKTKANNSSKEIRSTEIIKAIERRVESGLYPIVKEVFKDDIDWEDYDEIGRNIAIYRIIFRLREMITNSNPSDIPYPNDLNASDRTTNSYNSFMLGFPRTYRLAYTASGADIKGFARASFATGQAIAVVNADNNGRFIIEPAMTADARGGGTFSLNNPLAAAAIYTDNLNTIEDNVINDLNDTIKALDYLKFCFPLCSTAINADDFVVKFFNSYLSLADNTLLEDLMNSMSAGDVEWFADYMRLQPNIKNIIKDKYSIDDKDANYQELSKSLVAWILTNERTSFSPAAIGLNLVSIADMFESYESDAPQVYIPVEDYINADHDQDDHALPSATGNVRLCANDDKNFMQGSTFKPYGIAITGNNYNWGERSKPTLTKVLNATEVSRQTFGARYDPLPEGILFTSLAVILRNAISLKQTNGAPWHLFENVADLPLYIKERIRAFIPVFKSMFQLLINKCELYGKVLKNTDVNVARVLRADLKNVNNVKSTSPLHSPWPGKLLTDAYLKELNETKKSNESYRGYLDKLLDSLTRNCQSMISCCETVVREIGDEPKYFETRAGSIKDHLSNYKMLPFMPLSLTLAPFGSSQQDAEANIISVGSDVIDSRAQFMYGIRGLLSNLAVKSSPDVLSHWKTSFEEMSAFASLNKDDLDKYSSAFVDVMKFNYDVNVFKAAMKGATLNKRNGVHGTYRPFEFINRVANVDDVKNKNMIAISVDVPNAKTIGYSKPLDFKNASDIIAIVESSDPRKFIESFGERVHRRDVGDTLETQNIVDMDILPINPHSLMRFVPFANIFNYAYTFDVFMIEDIYAPTVAKEKVSQLCSGNSKIETAADAYIDMIINPYDDWFSKKGQYSVIEQLGPVCRGELGFESGRIPFIGTEIYNKLIFGSLYESKDDYSIDGPRTTDKSNYLYERADNDVESFIFDVYKRLVSTNYKLRGAANAARRVYDCAASERDVKDYIHRVIKYFKEHPTLLNIGEMDSIRIPSGATDSIKHLIGFLVLLVNNYKRYSKNLAGTRLTNFTNVVNALINGIQPGCRLLGLERGAGEPRLIDNGATQVGEDVTYYDLTSMGGKRANVTAQFGPIIREDLDLIRHETIKRFWLRDPEASGVLDTSAGAVVGTQLDANHMGVADITDLNVPLDNKKDLVLGSQNKLLELKSQWAIKKDPNVAKSQFRDDVLSYNPDQIEEHSVDGAVMKYLPASSRLRVDTVITRNLIFLHLINSAAADSIKRTINRQRTHDGRIHGESVLDNNYLVANQVDLRDRWRLDRE